jgi:hypothetical protein
MAINPAHSERLLSLEREVAQLRAVVQSRTPSTTGNRRPIVRWGRTIDVGGGVPYPTAAGVWPFVFTQHNFDEDTGDLTSVVLGDEDDPQHAFYSPSDYPADSEVLIAEVDGQWWAIAQNLGKHNCIVTATITAAVRVGMDVTYGVGSVTLLDEMGQSTGAVQQVYNPFTSSVAVGKIAKTSQNIPGGRYFLDAVDCGGA